MEEITLKKGFWYKMIKFIFEISDYEMPDDTCSLRSKILIVLFVFPIYFPTWLIGRIMLWIAREDNEFSLKLGILAQINLSIIALFELIGFYGDFDKIHGWGFSFIWWGVIPIAIVFALVFLAIAYVYVFIAWIIEKLPNKKVRKENIFKELYKSAREKYCKKIIWK